MKNSGLISVTIDKHIACLDLIYQPEGFGDTYQLLVELSELCEQIAAADRVRVVVLNPGGGRLSFSTNAIASTLNRIDQIPMEEHRCAADMLARLPQPVIVGIGAEMSGPGLELALACDLRVAVDGIRFSMSHVMDGEMPSWGGTQRLTRLVGKGPALQLLLTGEAIDAREAERIGLINRMVNPDQLEATTMELAAKLASKGPIALRYLKEAVYQGMDMSLEQGLRLEADLYFLLHTSRDRNEGVRAFQEKRSARFEGQ